MIRGVNSEKPDIKGVLLADKFGDLLFLNENKLGNLAKDPDSVPGHGQEGAETFDYVATEIYSHQQTCVNMCFSPCGRFLVSMDNLHKVMVLDFPKASILHSVNVDRKTEISDFCFREGSIATISHEKSLTEPQLVVSDLQTGKTSLTQSIDADFKVQNIALDPNGSNLYVTSVSADPNQITFHSENGKCK
jgi:WD40 repeat protein